MKKCYPENQNQYVSAIVFVPTLINFKSQKKAHSRKYDNWRGEFVDYVGHLITENVRNRHIMEGVQ